MATQPQAPGLSGTHVAGRAGEAAGSCPAQRKQAGGNEGYLLKFLSNWHAIALRISLTRLRQYPDLWYNGNWHYRSVDFLFLSGFRSVFDIDTLHDGSRLVVLYYST